MCIAARKREREQKRKAEEQKHAKAKQVSEAAAKQAEEVFLSLPFVEWTVFPPMSTRAHMHAIS